MKTERLDNMFLTDDRLKRSCEKYGVKPCV